MRFLRFITFVLFITLLSGCGWLKGTQFAPEYANYYGPASWPAIAHELELRNPPESIETLRSEWKIKVRAPADQGGKAKFKATMILEEPDHVRFRAFKMATLVMDMLVEGKLVTIHDRLGKQYYRGESSELRERDWLLGSLNPADLSQMLLIEQHIMSGLQSGRFKELPVKIPGQNDDERERIVLLQPSSERLVQALVMRTDTLLVEQAGLYIRSGGRLHRIPLKVEYLEYDLFGGWLLPKMIRIVNLDNDATVTLEATKFDINPDLHPKTFEMRIRGRAPVLPLSTLWDEGAEYAP